MTAERRGSGEHKHARVVRKKAGSWQKGGFGLNEFLVGAAAAGVICAASAVVYRSYQSAEHPVPVTRVNTPEKVAPKNVERKSKEVTITEDPEKVLEYIVNVLGAEKAGKILLNSGVYPVYSCTYKGRKILITPYSVDGQGIYNDSLWSAQPITFAVGKILYVATVINPLR